MSTAVDASADKLKLPAFNVFVIALVVVIGLYYPSIDSLLVEWGSSLYSHGWLVAAMFLFHLYRKSATVATQTPVHRIPGLLVVVGSALIWWVASITSILTLQFLALYGLVFGAIWCLWGWSMLLNLRYMLVAMALAMPLWQILQEPLRTLTTHVSYQFIQQLGVPVLLDNYMLTLPGGRFHVERACAGLSFVLTGTSLVFIFAAWQSLKFKALLRLLLLSTAIAILANWIRVITIVLVGNYTNMESELVEDHRAFGWVLFAVVYCPFLWFYVRKLSAQPEMTVQDYEFTGTTSGNQGYSVILLMFICMAILPVTHTVLSGIDGKPLMPAVEQVLDSEFSVKESRDAWRPPLPEVGSERFLSLDSGNVDLYLNENLSFQASSDTIGAHTSLFDTEEWTVLDKKSANGIASVVVRGGNRQRVIVYSFVVNGKRLPSVSGVRKAMLSAYFSSRPNLLVVAIKQDLLLHEDTGNVELKLRDLMDRLSSELLLQALQ